MLKYIRWHFVRQFYERICPLNIDVVDISKTHILVFKAEHILSKKVMERISNTLTEWKNQNGISIPHIVLDSGMSLDLIEKPV